MVAVKFSLADFVQEMEELLKSQPNQEKIFDRGSDSLSRLIANPDAIPDRFRMPVGEGRRANHGSWLLHYNPDSGLLVTSVVWGPGDHAAPHDHRTWGMIGVMDNLLTETRFRRVDDHNKEDWARLEQDRSATVKPGEVQPADSRGGRNPSDGQFHRPSHGGDSRIRPGPAGPGAGALRPGIRRHPADDYGEVRQLLVPMKGE